MRSVILVPCIHLRRCNSSTSAVAGATHKLKSAFIQGASKGIGLEYTKQLLNKHKVPLVFATYRSSNPSQLYELQSSLNRNDQQLHILRLDLNEEASIIEASKQTQQMLEEHSMDRLQCLINCSGILHDTESKMEPERSLNMINEEWLKILFQTHSIGPLLVLKHFHQLLAANAQKNSDPSILVNMSARVASIGDNGLGGWYGYRASKCALNQITKTASIELKRKNVITFCLHPGTVATDLSKPFQRGVKPEKLFDCEYSVECLLDIILNADMSMNGGYFDYKKDVIPW